MLTAYQRAIEWQMSLLRSMTDKPNPLAAWNRALAEAKDKDDAYKGPRAVQQPIGEGSRFYENLYYGRIDYGS